MSSLNLTRRFNSNINTATIKEAFTIDYNPQLDTINQKSFVVADGTTGIEVKMTSGGLADQTGNPVNLILISPDGAQYRSGIPMLFATAYDRGVAVATPTPGIWTVKVEGLQGVALPETISGTIAAMQLTGANGLNDIAGHPAEASTKWPSVPVWPMAWAPDLSPMNC